MRHREGLVEVQFRFESAFLILFYHKNCGIM